MELPQIDPITAVILIAVAIILMGLAFVAGRLLDPVQRVKVLRRLLRRDYGFLYVVSKDSQNIIKAIMVDFMKDRVVASKSRMDPSKILIWIICQGHIYREDATEKGSALKFKIRDGIPVAFVREDTLQSIDFDEFKSGAAPQEVGSLLNAFFNNQTAQRIAELMNMMPKSNDWSLPIILIILLLVGVGYFCWTISQQVSAQGATLLQMNATLSGASISHSPANGTFYGPTPTR